MRVKRKRRTLRDCRRIEHTKLSRRTERSNQTGCDTPSRECIANLFIGDQDRTTSGDNDAAGSKPNMAQQLNSSGVRTLGW